jgi:hypothetical protein
MSYINNDFGGGSVDNFNELQKGFYFLLIQIKIISFLQICSVCTEIEKILLKGKEFFNQPHKSSNTYPAIKM